MFASVRDLFVCTTHTHPMQAVYTHHYSIEDPHMPDLNVGKGVRGGIEGRKRWGLVLGVIRIYFA